VSANCRQKGGSQLRPWYVLQGSNEWLTKSSLKEKTRPLELRTSLLVAVAKARVWADEGWHVVVTDAEGTQLDPAEFDRLLAA
jgi:hypothetical protein